MVLKVIEYHECYHDTPGFREKLQAYEKEVENTSDSIKGLVKEVRKVVSAAKEFSKVQLAFADVLGGFSFETVGERSEMEDKILNSLKEFADHIRSIEEQRDRLTDNISIRVCYGLDKFRKDCISPLKEQKKQFERSTDQFYTSMDKRMACLTTKKKEQVLAESDKDWDRTKEAYQTQAFQYLESLQSVHEQKVFECMEPILGLMRDTFTFYHQSYEESQNLTPLCLDLQLNVQVTRDAYSGTMEKAQQLMKRVREKGATSPGVTRGYLYISEKKKGALSSWVRHYVEFHESGEFYLYLINPAGFKAHQSEKDIIKLKLDACTRCKTEELDRRFCFEVLTTEKRIFILQADSQASRRTWLGALGGKEPTYFDMETLPLEVEVTSEMIRFAQKCIATIEARGLDEEGIYRKSGMQAKISKTTKEIDKGKFERIDFSDETDYDIHTIAGCLKSLLANSLPEPVFTFSKHEDLILTGKISNYDERSLKLQEIIKDLPQSNQDLLKLLINHLSLVAEHSDKNMMRASNVGVVFGPTLMRPRDETVQSIMNIKYQNSIVQQLIEDFQRIFHGTVTVSSTGGARNSATMITRPVSQAINSSSSSRASFQPRFLEARQTLFIEPGRREASPDYPSIRPLSMMPKPPQPTRPPQPSGITKPPPPLPDPTRKPLLANRPFSVMVDSNHKPLLPPKTDLAASMSSPFKRKPVHREKLPLGARNSRGIQEGTEESSALDKRSQEWKDSVEAVSPPQLESSPSNNSTDGISTSGGSDSNVLPPRTEKIKEVDNGTSKGQKARAIFDCDGENDNELCFKKFDVFENVRNSDEPQWLYADLRGKRGLIPENYIEYIV